MENNIYRIVYFTAEGYSSTVFESQVRSVTDRLRLAGVVTSLVVLQPYKPLLRPEASLKFIREKIKGDSYVFMKPRFDDIDKAIKHAKSIGKRLLPKLGSDPLIFHCRGPEAALYGLEIANLRETKTSVLYDVRGAAFDEYKKSDPALARYFSGVESRVFADVDGYSFVSANLKDSCHKRYNLKRKPFSINLAAYNEQIFSFNADNRLKMRSKMNWQSKKVFVYSGGTNDYQSLDRILGAFSELSQHFSHAHLLLLLARPLKGLRSTLATLNINPSNVTCFTRVPYNEMPYYLNAADWGLVFRKPDPINDVATPTKIAEYLGCGLRVIYGGEGSYYSALIGANPSLGVAVPFLQNLTHFLLPESDDNSRQQVSIFAQDNLSLFGVIRAYTNLYGQL